MVDIITIAFGIMVLLMLAILALPFVITIICAIAETIQYVKKIIRRK